VAQLQLARLACAPKICGLFAAPSKSAHQLSWLANGYCVPSFGTPPFDYQTTTLCLHPCQKAVCFSALAIIWLECAFHLENLSATPILEWANLVF
jgi:hypothetical protein